MRPLRLASVLCLAAGLASAPARGWQDPAEGQWVMRVFYTADNRATGTALAFSSAPNGDIFVAANNVYVVRPSFAVSPLTTGSTSGYRAIAAASANRVWAGTSSDLGYLARDANGEFAFTSLKSHLPAAYRGPGQSAGAVQAILPHGAAAASFLTEKAVFFWDGQTFQVWPLNPDDPLAVLRPRPDQIWLYQPQRGLFEPTPAGLRPLRPANFFPGDLRWLLPPAGAAADATPGPGWMAGTDEAAYLHEAGGWTRLDELSDALRDARPTAAVALPDETIAVATRNKGVLIADRTGRVVSSISSHPYLEDNQVLALWLDRSNDLWLGMSSGFVRVSSPQRVSRLLPQGNRQSTQVRDVAFVADQTYVAASGGVYQVRARADAERRARLESLPSPPGPVWTLASLNDQLIAGGAGGLWEWRAPRWVSRRPAPADVTCSLVSRHHPGRLYYAAGNRLEVFAPQEPAAVAGLDLGDQPTRLVEDEAGTLWVSTVANALIQVRVGPGSLALGASFAPGRGLPAGLKQLLPTTVGPKVVVFTDTDLLELDDPGAAFVPIAAFAGLRGQSAGSARPGQRTLWLLDCLPPNVSWLQSFLAEIRWTPDHGWEMIPLATESLSTLGSRMDQIYPTPDGRAVLIRDIRTLLRLGDAALRPMPAPPRPRLTSIGVQMPSANEPALRRPQIQTATVAGPPRPPDLRLPLSGPVPVLPPEAQRIRFELAIDDGEDGFFQTRLGGLEADWSATMPSSVREYTGLAAGRYEFRARTVDRAGRVGPEIVYPFVKESVWYLRWPAWIVYSLLVVLLVAAGMRWRVRSLQRQNEALNRKVEERTRELALANTAKMEFLASISHEIRNPLNGVIGLVTLLNQSPLAPRERELTRSLAACARSLRRVFDEVLGFARLEEGRVSIQSAPFSLPALLQDIAGVFAAEATLRGSRLAVAIEGEPPLLLGDEEKIRTVVTNFVANALKYAPGSPIEVTGVVEPLPTGSHTVDIHVRDHGPGIPDEEQELIFRKFVRGSSAKEQRETGAGLGLATCQALAKLMGGGVGIESKRGQGSTFYLHLELPAAPAALGTAPEPAPAASPDPAPRSRLALVVEDQGYNQLVARNILERLGYRSVLAANGEAARTAIARGGFALALVDWDVPGAKGDELARALRTGPDGEQVTILAVTAHDAEDIRARCLTAGMDGFLVKPLDEDLLAHTLRNLRDKTAGRSRELPVATEPDFQVFTYLGRNDPARTRAAAADYLAQLDAESRLVATATSPRELAASAHRLRAHAAIVHFAPLRDAAKHLQEQAETANPAERAALLAAVHRATADLRHRLEALLAPPDRPLNAP